MKAPKRLSQIITAAVLVVFIIYFALNREKFHLLLHVNLWLLLVIFVADIALIANNGLFTKFILVPFGKFIPLLESFYVSLISTVGNFFAPVGAGFGFRAVYLKHKFGLSYSNYISTLSGNYVIVFFVDSVFGLLALFMLRSRKDSEYTTLLVFFLLVLATSIALSLIRAPSAERFKFKNKRLNKAAEIIRQIAGGWNHIKSHKKLMVQLLGLTVINFAITAFITWVEIKSLHLSVGIATLMLFAALSSMSLFINITPANLGVKEAIYLFSSSVLGFSAAQILSIALIDRGVMFAVLLLLWLFSSKLRSKGKFEEATG